MRFWHDLAAVDGLVLTDGSCSVAEGQEVVGTEGVRTILVCVQNRNQRRSFLNDANASVAVAVDASLVTFGQAEPTLQVEVVVRQVRLVAAHKQAGQKAAHQLGHVLADGISRAAVELLLQGLKRAGAWRQGRCRDRELRSPEPHRRCADEWFPGESLTAFKPRSMQLAKRRSCW